MTNDEAMANAHIGMTTIQSLAGCGVRRPIRHPAFVIRHFFFAILFASVCNAEPPSTAFIFPAGAQRGTSAEFRVGGYYFHGHAQFAMEGEGITAPSEIKEVPTIWFEGPMLIEPASQKGEDYPKDHLGSVTVANDAPPGTRTWWCRTSQGSTPSMKFVIGDLPEITEREIDGAPIPQEVTLPVTINGRIFPREDVDVWRFHAGKGEVIRCDIASRSLGYPLKAVLTLTTATGKPIGNIQKHTSRAGDPAQSFTAPADGEYQIAVHDAAYGGGPSHVYRLTLQRGPAPATELQRPASNVLALPASVNGCIAKPGEVDEWLMDLAEGQTVLIDVETDREHGRLDSVLAIHGADGALLAKNDDRTDGQTDSRLHFTAAKAGRYGIKVADRFATRGGVDFTYQLRATACAAADFELTLASDAVNVIRESDADVAADPKTKTKPARGTGLKVDLTALGALKSDITLEVAGLPAGVTAQKTVINPNQKSAEIFFTAPPKTPLQLARITVRGTAGINGAQVVHDALVAGSEQREVRLAVVPPVPFRHVGEYWVTNDQPAGATMMKHYKLDRGGFTGPITVRLADRQGRTLQNVTASPLVLPADATEFDYTVVYPPEVELGHTSRVQLMLVAGMTDFDGSRHTISHTSFAQDDQMISVTSDGLLRIVPAEGTYTFTPGGHTTVPFTIKRHPKLANRALRIELQLPAHIRDVSAQPVLLAPDAAGGELRLDFGKAPGPFNMPVTILARTSDAGSEPHTAAAKIELLPALNAASR